MESLSILDIAREALWTLIKVSAPIMLIAMSVGLVISLIQALTQVQELTLSFVPKMLAIFFSLIILLPYIASQISGFVENLQDMIINIQ